MWKRFLRNDPLPALLSAEDVGLRFHVENDLLGERIQTLTDIWGSRAVTKIIEKQSEKGYWLYTGRRPGEEFGENYELVETWKMLRILIGKYGFHCEHPAMQRAVDFLFSCQSEEGDIRGILSNQYTPYYNGMLLELLIKAGYEDDRRLKRAMDWLLSMRQSDGGWIIPLNMFKQSEYYNLAMGKPINPDRNLPSSHMATGMAIRPFCIHPTYRPLPEVKRAGALLAERLFQKDQHSFRQATDYWFKLQYPFWWTNLLSVLDCLAVLGFSTDHKKVKEGLKWFSDNQRPDGTWRSSYEGKTGDADLWVSYAVCRMLKSFLG